MTNKDEFSPGVEYRHLSEVEVAYKYFDWGFYLGRRNVSLETMTKDEIKGVLQEYPFQFKNETLAEMERKRKYEYAKRMSYDDLVRGM